VSKFTVLVLKQHLIFNTVSPVRREERSGRKGRCNNGGGCWCTSTIHSPPQIKDATICSTLVVRVLPSFSLWGGLQVGINIPPPTEIHLASNESRARGSYFKLVWSSIWRVVPGSYERWSFAAHKLLVVPYQVYFHMEDFFMHDVHQEPISYHLSYNNLTLDVVRKLFQHCSIVIDGYMYAKCCYRWVSWALDRSKNYLHKLESQQCHFHWHECGSTGYTNGAAWPGCYCTV